MAGSPRKFDVSTLRNLKVLGPVSGAEVGELMLSSSIFVLLSRFGDRRDKGSIKEFAARLMAGQMDSGGWHYTCPGKKNFDAEKYLKDPSTGPKPKEGYGDNSCTQFAVLGLWVASRTGINVDKTLAKVAQRFVKTQADDGGWTFNWEAWSPIAASEWRGSITVDALRTLRANGRL